MNLPEMVLLGNALLVWGQALGTEVGVFLLLLLIRRASLTRVVGTPSTPPC
jgi:hypothetical protein